MSLPSRTRFRRPGPVLPLLTVGALAGALLGGTVLTGCASTTVAGPSRPVAPAQTGAATGSTAAGGGTAAPGTGTGTGTGTTVATFHGDGGDPYDTAAFTVHGRRIHFVYTVQPNDVGPVPFLWSMYRQGEPVDPAHPRASDSCASCDGRQDNDLGVVPAGSYHLHVITSRSWTLTVLEN
jgi:hypothetical protein